MTARLWRWISLLALWLCGALPLGAAAGTVVLGDAQPRQSINRQLLVLEDASGRLTIDGARAARSPSPWVDRRTEHSNFGYSTSAMWLRTEVLNQSPHQRDWMLGLRYPLLDYLDVYVIWPDGRMQHHATGDRRPFKTRPVADRHFYVPIRLAHHEAVQVYVRVQGQGSLQVPLEITTPQAHDQVLHRDQWLLGIYGGALAAMLIYNLLLGLSLRERVYLYYVVYVGLFGAAQFTLNGLAFEHLWPSQPDWGNQAAPLFMALAGWALVLFSRQFLALAQHRPRIDLMMRGLQYGFLAVLPAVFLLPYAIPIKVTTTGTLVAPAILLMIAGTLLHRGIRQARYFLAAFTGLLLGVILTSLQMFGMVRPSVLTEYGILIGSLLEFTLLSFALAHRMKLARDENERLQRAHASELEARVKARTRELDQAMCELTAANTQLHEQTQHDALTGLKNRMFLNERLPEIWRHAQRWQQTIAMLMIDIDHFKRINDQHGHAAGDEGLRQVAQVISRMVQRPGDHAVRYGGEEFMVILPQTHAAGAAHIAEAIRLGVQDLVYQTGQQSIQMTVSIGVACTVPTQTMSPDTLIRAADQLLYQAKHAGRNRCTLQPAALARPGTAGVKPGQPAPASSG